MEDTPTELAPNTQRAARPRQAGLFLALVAVLAILLGACSSSGSSADSPSGQSGSSAPQAVPRPDRERRYRAAAGVDPNSPQFRQAWQERQSKLPGNLQGQQP